MKGIRVPGRPRPAVFADRRTNRRRTRGDELRAELGDQDQWAGPLCHFEQDGVTYRSKECPHRHQRYLWMIDDTGIDKCATGGCPIFVCDDPRCDCREGHDHRAKLGGPLVG